MHTKLLQLVFFHFSMQLVLPNIGFDGLPKRGKQQQSAADAVRHFSSTSILAADGHIVHRISCFELALKTLKSSN